MQKPIRVVYPLGGPGQSPGASATGPEQASRDTETSTPPGTGEADEPMRILLVEDNSDESDLIQFMLSDVEGLAVEITVEDRLAGALERLRAGGFDAVLLDLSLPDSHGVATFFRVMSEAPEVPIIVLTGLDNDDVASHVIRDGAQDYIVKGTMSGKFLARVIRHALDRHRKTRERRRAAMTRRTGRVLSPTSSRKGLGIA